ncbi:hypothetical protein TNCV_3480541 [Trichonephila clavipes]|nr:hypothetical protein TNCV_3480541 [Trichonephila clavipes]
MMSRNISFHICCNLASRSLELVRGPTRHPKLSQICSIGDRSGDRASQENVLRVRRQSCDTLAVMPWTYARMSRCPKLILGVIVYCKQWQPTPSHQLWERCVAVNKRRIETFTTGFPHTNTIDIAADIESEFNAKDDLVPTRCSHIPSYAETLLMKASMGGRQRGMSSSGRRDQNVLQLGAFLSFEKTLGLLKSAGVKSGDQGGHGYLQCLLTTVFPERLYQECLNRVSSVTGCSILHERDIRNLTSLN